MPINLKRSFTEYIVSTAQSEFVIGYKDYQGDKDVIHVTVNDVDAATAGFTVTRINSTTIKLVPDVPVTSPVSVVRLQRETNIDASFHKFSEGAKWNAQSMDENFEQILHSQQEARDGFDKLRDDVLPLVDGLEEALQQAQDASEAAQDAAEAAESAAEQIDVVYNKVYEITSIKDFGAIGDGTKHPVSEWTIVGSNPYYPNLAAIQVDYPFVTSLTDSIDWVALQGAIKSLPLNTASTGVLTPKGFANGGYIYIPRGRYYIDKKVDMQRGLRLGGESRESSQLISYIPNNSVLQYTDQGRYIQDEIVIENLSIWQDETVPATAGAAVDVIEGTASIQSLYLKMDNVYIEGTYFAVRHQSGVGGAIRNCNFSQTVSYGVLVNGSSSTTSMIFENTYCHICGDDGFHIERGAYIHWSACASDSNNGVGYYLNNVRGYQLSACGAEVNTESAMYIKTSGGGSVNLFAISNGEGVVKLDATEGETVFIGGNWNGEGVAIRHVLGASKVRILGTNLEGDYITQTASSEVYLLNEASTVYGKLVGGTNNRWSIGVTSTPDAESGLNVGGIGGADTTISLKVNQLHTKAGSQRNVAGFFQTLIQNVAITVPLACANFIANASKGALATVQRTAGLYIQNQTLGNTANANIMIDAGTGTVPAGNWSIYNGSANPNYHAGSQTWKPAVTATPANNGDLTFEKTSDTVLTVKLKGSDGVVRKATLTLTV